MSRSNNTDIQNPAVRYYEWKGGDGDIRYWDKNKGEKGEEVKVPLPFSFLVLDRLSCITGFSDAHQSGYWSNEVRNLKTDKLTVRTKKGVVATDLYANLSGVMNQGAQYAQSVYIAIKGADGKLEIANIKFTGSSVGPWIDLMKGKDIYKYAVVINGKVPKKKGKTEYFEPVFALKDVIKPETEAEAIELDKVLQEYLSSYFKRTNTQQVESSSDQAAVTSMVASSNGNGNGSEEVVDVNAITVPLDDLPF
jgi:hypothetical protein